MENENVNVNENENGSQPSLVEQVLELKKNSVSKEEYQKLVEQNSELMAALINGDSAAANSEGTEEPENISQIVSDLRKMDNNTPDIEYVEQALKFRNAVIDQYGEEYDPFCPNQAKYTPTVEDKEKAQHVAEVFQQCIDEAQGSNAVFLALLQERTRDSVKLKKK